MNMLALPYAQAARPQAPDAETRLSAILQGLADPTTDQNERELLKGLTDLSAQSERIAGDITYRFSAGRAYAQIIRQRVRSLHLAQIQDLGDLRL